MNKILNTIDALSEWVGKVFAWFALPMIAVLVYEVTARRLANSPTDWAHESTTMLYGTFCILGAVWTLREKGHVRTEVIYQLMPTKLQQFCDVLTGLLTFLMLVILFWASFEFAADAWAKQEISSKSTWGVPVYPFKTVIPLAAGLMALQQFAHLMRDIMRLFRRRRARTTVIKKPIDLSKN